MPEETDEELGIDEGLDPNIRKELRKARELARDKEASDQRAADLERELAFAKAGIPDSPLNTKLAQSYDGANDPESVKAYFEGLGVNLAQDSGGASDTELDQQRQIAQVGNQGEPGADMRFEDAINSAKNVDEVMALIASAPPGATGWIDGRERQVQPPRID